ncbi:MAG: histidine phosphatase family protein [Nonlabens sp.]
MKQLLLLVLLAVTACNDKNTAQTTVEDHTLTTFYFIRHAEKQKGPDPELTEQGLKRADAWKEYFFLKDVDAILSSNFKRTKQTAEPLASSKKMDVTIYDVGTMNGKKLLEEYRGSTVVLYGHSNTINSYANDLQTEQSFKELDESVYDQFFVVRIDDRGNASAVKETMDFMD